MPRMMSSAGIDDLIPVLVFLAIAIGQIMKARAKARQGGEDREQRPPPSGSASPQDELQEFLRSLSGAPPPPATPVPPPAPPQIRPPRRVPAAAPPVRPQPRAWSPTPVPNRPPPRTRTAAPPPVPTATRVVALPQAPDPDASAYATETKVRKSAVASRRQLRIALGKDLISRQSLRKAIVLKEIVGSPLGSRR